MEVNTLVELAGLGREMADTITAKTTLPTA